MYFASTLIGLKHNLEKLKAIGTDGEAALVDAFSHELDLPYTCVIYLRRNIKQQLCSQHFLEEHIKITLEEIFDASKGSVHVEGLIDCESCEEFDNKLALLKPIGMPENQAVLGVLQIFMSGLSHIKLKY